MCVSINCFFFFFEKEEEQGEWRGVGGGEVVTRSQINELLSFVSYLHVRSVGQAHKKGAGIKQTIN